MRAGSRFSCVVKFELMTLPCILICFCSSFLPFSHMTVCRIRAQLAQFGNCWNSVQSAWRWPFANNPNFATCRLISTFQIYLHACVIQKLMVYLFTPCRRRPFNSSLICCPFRFTRQNGLIFCVAAREFKCPHKLNPFSAKTCFLLLLCSNWGSFERRRIRTIALQTQTLCSFTFIMLIAGEFWRPLLIEPNSCPRTFIISRTSRRWQTQERVAEADVCVSRRYRPQHKA